MASSKKTEPDAPAIADAGTPEETPALEWHPSSAELVLHYLDDVGQGRPINGIPARDLTVNDLCRIVHKRAMVLYEPLLEGSVRPDPLAPDQAAVTALVEELVSRGTFTTDLPEPEPESEAETPADPVEGDPPTDDQTGEAEPSSDDQTGATPAEG